MPVTATFPKTGDRPRVATFTWSDGLAATTPIWDPPRKLPHDLDHYIVEAAFRPAYGFWAMVEQQAPFRSLTLVAGRWPRGRHEWLQRTLRKHGGEMLKAEASGMRPLLEAESEAEVDALIPGLRRQLRTAYRLGPSQDFTDLGRDRFVAAWKLAKQLHRTWAGVPMGGALQVAYPPAGRPAVVQKVPRP